MLTYDFHDREDETLTAYLYRRIREDILEGRLKAGEKMPSKRAFSRNLGVSTVTVENVYAQLAAEGYLMPKARSGYFIAEIGDALLVPRRGSEDRNVPGPSGKESGAEGQQGGGTIDLSGAKAEPETFPFGTWAKIVRGVLAARRTELLTRSPGNGIPELRQEIASYLLQYQSMNVSPDQIIIGAGTEYLYSLLIRLLGNDKVYALETPGYLKTGRIYESNRVRVRYIPMDGSGISMDALKSAGADVVHISPSHQFPTGITMPVRRRAELLRWAGEKDGRYIIEDDYDSEFRLSGRPIPSLMSIDQDGRVIYLNTFTKSLASTIRISYMVLPRQLLWRYRRQLGFYSCTVSNFEQYTLAEFIRQGFFEKHINRMRTYYRKKQNLVLSSIEKSRLADMTEIVGEDAGLHFLLRVSAGKSGQELTELAAEKGVVIYGLEHYRQGGQERVEEERSSGEQKPSMVVSYSGLTEEQIETFPGLLSEAWTGHA